MRDRYDEQERWQSSNDSSRWRDGDRPWGGNFRQMGPRGPHTGKGPKGYQRSDDRIREDISDALMTDGDVDASEIEIRVTGGEVILTGTVDSRDTKRAAEDLAERIHGVKDVRNELRLSRGENGQGSSDESRRSQTGQSSLLG
jgi:hypothetical protein